MGKSICVLTAGCLAAIAIYYIRKRLKERRNDEKCESTRVQLSDPMEIEMEEDINYTTVQRDQDFIVSHSLRKLTIDRYNESSNIVIGVCGGTGSGKTTLSAAIVKRLGEENVTYLCHDYYYKDLEHLTIEQRARHNFDHPDSLDNDLITEHLRQLKEGLNVDIPVYDFATHSRLKETKKICPKRVILVEGILIYTHKELVDLMDIKIFVETPADIRFIRRLKRDIEDRGRTVDTVMSQYMKTVRPMHMTFVEPSKRVADIIIPQGVNNVALDMIISRLRSFTAE